DALRHHGALFASDLVTITRRLPNEIQEALWDAVARGLVTSDGFDAVRSLLYQRVAARLPSGTRLRRAGSRSPGRYAGRWSPGLGPPQPARDRPPGATGARARRRRRHLRRRRPRGRHPSVSLSQLPGRRELAPDQDVRAAAEGNLGQHPPSVVGDLDAQVVVGP